MKFRLICFLLSLCTALAMAFSASTALAMAFSAGAASEVAGGADDFEAGGVINDPATEAGITLKALITEVGIKLDWAPNNNPFGYRIFRSTSEGARGVSIIDFPIVGGKFVDVNVKEYTQYYYTIHAIEIGAMLNRETGAFTEEKLGPPSKTLAARTEPIVLMPSAPKRNFILMEIGVDTMLVNENRVEIDPGRGTSPRILDNRTVVPIRAIIEAMGGSVGWNEATREISITAYDYTAQKIRSILMTLDKTTIIVDDEEMEIDVAPTTINGRTMVPIRFVAENIGCLIQWTIDEEIIIVFYSG